MKSQTTNKQKQELAYIELMKNMPNVFEESQIWEFLSNEFKGDPRYKLHTDPVPQGSDIMWIISVMRLSGVIRDLERTRGKRFSTAYRLVKRDMSWDKVISIYKKNMNGRFQTQSEIDTKLGLN